ncbi:MAG: hypothetical protein ACXVZX_00890 [Terriglobales bacterium]
MIGLRGATLFLLAIFCVGCGTAPQTQSTGSGSAQSSQSGGSSTSTIPPNAAVIADIQKMPNWSSCSSTCSGETGTNAVYSMQQGVASPSLTGSAIQFDITGGTPWGTALWWKQVGGNDAMTHFVYNISFYLTDVNAAQALEFNANQNAGGNRYEYATQCDIKGSHHWRVWPQTQKHWVDTGVSCPAPMQDAWNQLTWELSRNSSNQIVFEAVTFNGVRSAINRTFDSNPASGSGIDVAFQMDSDGGPTPWSVWVDEVSLTEW